MIKSSNSNIIKNKINCLMNLKCELNYIIIKSIIQNSQIKNKNRVFIKLLISNQSFLTKNKKICVITGNKKSVNKKISIGRHSINYFASRGVLNNFKINSW